MLYFVGIIIFIAMWFVVSDGIGTIFDMIEEWARG